MSRRHRKPKKPRTTFAVVADGETEMWYLQMLKRNEPAIHVDIRPRISSKKKLEDQCDYVRNLAEDYTKVFWMVDLDAIFEDSRQVPKGKETPLEKFIKYTREFETNKTVEVIVNNPCLEFWFLLHFEKTSKYFSRCEKTISQLKNHLPDYEKSQKFFTKQDNDIYLRLKDKLPDALKNSTVLGKFNSDDPERAMCEMEIFFNSLVQQRGKVL